VWKPLDLARPCPLGRCSTASRCRGRRYGKLTVHRAQGLGVQHLCHAALQEAANATPVLAQLVLQHQALSRMWSSIYKACRHNRSTISLLINMFPTGA
jgi:hypothetical protein